MTETIELSDRQAERFEAIREECKEADPELPPPNDEQVMKGLLDTWDAAGDGWYTEDYTSNERLRELIEEWRGFIEHARKAKHERDENGDYEGLAYRSGKEAAYGRAIEGLEGLMSDTERDRPNIEAARAAYRALGKQHDKYQPVIRDLEKTGLEHVPEYESLKARQAYLRTMRGWLVSEFGEEVRDD